MVEKRTRQEREAVVLPRSRPYHHLSRQQPKSITFSSRSPQKSLFLTWNGRETVVIGCVIGPLVTESM
jgi:hypothetical protein